MVGKKLKRLSLFGLGRVVLSDCHSMWTLSRLLMAAVDVGRGRWDVVVMLQLVEGVVGVAEIVEKLVDLVY